MAMEQLTPDNRSGNGRDGGEDRVNINTDEEE